VILVYDRHNIFAMRFSIMIIIIPYTTNSILSTFNRIMDCRNSLTKCHKVVKLESPTIRAHATSWLATQHWNFSLLAKHEFTPIKKAHYDSLLLCFQFCLNFGSTLIFFLLCKSSMPISFLLHKSFYLLLIHFSSHY
jgi:hypothetical protein